MDQLSQIAALLKEHTAASLHRSDVLKPLAWITGISLTGAIAATYLKAPLAILYGTWLLVAVEVLCYVVSYFYCLFHDKDALRSERYSLQKMAIQQGLFGDSMSGMIQADLDPKRTISGAAEATVTTEEAPDA